MKKIIVIGCPGSGKSCFSRALHQKTDIPLYHMDLLYWKSDRSQIARPLFVEKLAKILARDAWIMDGNYPSTMEMRIAACDTVFFLDYPLAVCLDGVEKRRGKPRSDMPWIEVGEDPEFVGYIHNFNSYCRPQILALLEKYKDKSITVFTSREEADAFLRNETDR